MDKLHPGWETRCGLEPCVMEATGRVEWLPPEVAREVAAGHAGMGK